MTNTDFFNWDLIDLKGKISGQIKTKCPECTEQRSNKSDKSLSVSIDSGVAFCHYCNKKSIRDKHEKKQYDLPDQTWHNFTSLSDEFVKYFKSRGISQSTLIENKITEEPYWQPAIQRKVKNIVFNYFEGDTLVSKKYRSKEKNFTQSANTKNIFYGINDVIGEKEVYIVEGEIDKLSLWEVGVKNCISVPNGANDNDDVWINCEGYLDSVERFFIATDNDPKGNEVAEKIAQRLGRWRCERVIFKNKDANDDLQESVFVLEKSLTNKKKYPVSGTFNSEDLEDDILDLYRKGIPETISPKSSWFYGFKEIFSVMMGQLVTVTGIPSHGKSTIADWYVLNLINDYGFKASWFSPEHSPMSLHKSRFISLFYGKPFFKTSSLDRVTEGEIKRYNAWAKDKVYLTSPERGESPTWGWLFKKFKEQLFNYGINIFVIDAFNKVKFDSVGNRKDQIDSVLTELTSFCQINNVIIFLVAHPTKMKKKDDGNYEMPTLYDVSGSADFRNQTHNGFCIYRNFVDGMDSETLFINLKTKFTFQGEIGKSLPLKYHKNSGRFYPKGQDYDPRPLVNLEPELKQWPF